MYCTVQSNNARMQIRSVIIFDSMFIHLPGRIELFGLTNISKMKNNDRLFGHNCSMRNSASVVVGLNYGEENKQ